LHASESGGTEVSVYLKDIPLSEARDRFEEALRAAGRWEVLGTEDVLLDERAAGRVLAAPIWARRSSPHYHAAAMDGFAVRSADTEGAMPTSPVTLAVGTQAMYVDTGDPVPLWADAVIAVEFVEPLDDQGVLAPDPRRPSAVRIRAAATPLHHVRAMGEDIVETELVLPAGHVLRPIDLGAVAAAGHDTVSVARRPRVAVLPTGSELVPLGIEVEPGQIPEYNSLVLAAQIREWGGEATRYPIVPDDLDEIRKQVLDAAATHDLVLLNAGSSAGSEDFSSRVVESLGRLLVHGVAIRPGHPVILGMIDNLPKDSLDSRPVPIIGVPGYPVSTALTGEIFVEPLVGRWLGRQPVERPQVKAVLTRKTTSPGGDDDFMRVAVGRVGDRVVAAPLSRGAGVITSLVRADGLVVMPRGCQGLPAGEEVTVRLYRSVPEIDRTIVAIGSHDLTLDLFAQFLAGRGRRLASANAGSLGGLVALRRKEAHFAGSHLLDAETGEYNVSYIKQHLPGVPVRLLAFVGRTQGLMVKRGNPDGIRDLRDLARPGVVFVNRQRGAGTRVLLDYHLGQAQLVPAPVGLSSLARSSALSDERPGKAPAASTGELVPAPVEPLPDPTAGFFGINCEWSLRKKSAASCWL
jgi:putative molybdopterin biosynthesis protein